MKFNLKLVYMWRRFVSAMLRKYAPFFLKKLYKKKTVSKSFKSTGPPEDVRVRLKSSVLSQ